MVGTSHARGNQPPSPTVPSFLTIEYIALRAEMLKRIELQHQIFNFTLVALGVILTAGFASQIPSVILLFPIIILFTASASFSNVDTIRRLGYYIKTQLEPHLRTSATGWENSNLVSGLNVFYGLGNIVFSTFVSVLILGAGLYFQSTFSPYERVLLIIAGICWLITLMLIFLFSRGSRPNKP